MKECLWTWEYVNKYKESLQELGFYFNCEHALYVYIVKQKQKISQIL